MTARKKKPTSKRTSPRSARAKARGTKAAKAKAGARKAPARKAASKRAEPERKPPAPARAARRAPRRTARPPPHPLPPLPKTAHPRLGVKYLCFQCGAKFYDLNRPEPLCPKCGADQRERPSREAKPKLPAESERAARAMAPLLDEDEETLVLDNEELDLGLEGVASTEGVLVEEVDEADEEEEETP